MGSNGHADTVHARRSEQASSGRTTPEWDTLATGAGRRVGYVVAALVNLVILWVVNNLSAWGWPAFLTEDFDRLLPVIDVTLVATAVVNLVWAVRDPAWLRHAAQLGLDLISIVAGVRTWQVFPFDFSGYSFDWEPLVRVGIGLGLFGLAAASIVEAVKLVRVAGQ